MPLERTKPRYPTEGPGDGRTWNQYFRDLKGRDVVDPGPDDPDDEVESFGDIVIVLPAVEVPDNWVNVGAPGGLRTWRNRLLANDWQFKVGGSVAWHPDKYYLNGNLEKSAHWVDCWWINAIKNGIYITITYYIRDGENYSGWTTRTTKHEWFKLYSDKEMKELIESGSA